MLQLLNIITFICTSLGRGVDGQKLWGLGHGSPETVVHLGMSPASPNPPGIADMEERGLYDTFLLALFVKWHPSQTLQRKEGGRGNQVSTKCLLALSSHIPW